ncbi:MAG: NTP transferase domain-containing protein [Rhodothermales bacterium]|nr:NTP transferase domain-containing protein [Rhodothermales bacterium]MBO6778091.1 NTP transferase domain-containing protein [Rhodothermales bacterium]
MATTERTGLILAAGFGSRLAENGHAEVPKPLIQLGGTSLIVRALQGLEAAGCTRSVIVLGHRHSLIRRAVEDEYAGSMPIQFVFNERYDLSNGVSVLSAAPHLGNEFVLVMADHVVSEDVMLAAGAHVPPEDGATLLVDYRIDQVFDLDDATKVVERDGRIAAIGKHLTEYNCIDIGVFVCTRALLDAIQVVYDREGDASLSHGVQALSGRGTMHVLDIGDGFWQDVDTPDMLDHVQQRLGLRAAG